MPDLFTCDLSVLSFQDVDEFLGLSLPEDKRLPENSRIDYKKDFPSDLGDDVAALANAYGGLIFLGIKSDKNKNNVPVCWDGTQLGPDPSARISARILSTVRPRPLIDIGLVKAAGGVIAIVRVKDGDYPPYEYEQGNTVRISIRVNDTKRQASVRDIEGLMERRSSTSDGARKAIVSLQPDSLYTYRADPTPGHPDRQTRDERTHTMLLAPHRPLRSRLDVLFERQFERWIQGAFPNARTFSANFRSGTFYEVREIRDDPKRLHRVWRISRDGALGFARNMDQHGSPGEPVGDAAADLLFFFRLCRIALETAGSFGRTLFTDVLSSPSTSFLAKFPEPDGIHGYDDVGGIHFPPARPEVLPVTATWTDELDFQSIQAPIELTSSILLDQLRAIWGASIRYHRLLEAVTDLDVQSAAPGWGKR
jgi:hypothetical protein